VTAIVTKCTGVTRDEGTCTSATTAAAGKTTSAAPRQSDRSDLAVATSHRSTIAEAANQQRLPELAASPSTREANGHAEQPNGAFVLSPGLAALARP